MPARGLPGNANLEQLKHGAKSLQQAVRGGDAGAAEVVREFHPRLAQAIPGSPELRGFTRADAELVVARRFGFPSWAKLESYLEVTAAYARSPHEEPPGGHVSNELELADDFLRLACLTYGEDDPAHWRRAAELLDANPALARANIYTAAATGDVRAATEMLDRDASLANAQGGPHRWQPLLYLTYSRLEAQSPVELAALLLDHGADPNAGFLWEGLSPPFTALTGAFGSGEGDQPPHRHGMRLARLLLERGTEPNDAQTLYNRQWDPDDGWLELLFEFGLGTGDGGRWHRLLVPAHPTPRQMLEDELIAAARHGFIHRVRLLLEHHVQPNGTGTGHPLHGGRTPVQEAALWGSPEIVELLQNAGAQPLLRDVEQFLCAATRPDREKTRRMIEGDPTIVERARAERPDQLVRAAEKDDLEAVRC